MFGTAPFPAAPRGIVLGGRLLCQVLGCPHAEGDLDREDFAPLSQDPFYIPEAPKQRFPPEL